MPIPTQHDRDLGEIDDAASSIMVQLRTMQHAAARDVPRMRAALRERLQTYVDQVMALARDGR